MPFFSIIIPTYNRENFLSKAINSVLNQTFEDWELIIVDDGSTDNTRILIADYIKLDQRIKYKYQDNQERSAARNQGIELAIGEYICFLDSDDYYLNTRLTQLKFEIEKCKTKQALFFTDLIIDTEGKKIESIYNVEKLENKYDWLIKHIITSQQVCCTSTILKLNKFNINLSVGEDIELWMRIIVNNDIIYLKNNLTVVIVDHENRTVGNNKPEAYIKHIATFKFIKSIYNKSFSSSSIIDLLIHDGLMGLARSYSLTNQNSKMVLTLIRTLKYSISRSVKEKFILLVTSFVIFRPFIKLYKFFR
jgi:glycosyltransferase involved in cell wall biosynthesis